MLKNLLRIPDTFDPDDRRQRQVLNAVLIFFIALHLATLFIIALAYCNCMTLSYKELSEGLLTWISISFAVFIILLFMNRSHRIPSWLSRALFLIIFMAILTQADTPYELYNGRSLVVWGIPIMVAAVIFHPRYTFLVTLAIC